MPLPGTDWWRIVHSASFRRMRRMPRTRQKLVTLDAVEEISRRVPGYKGYQELTQRREDDRRFPSSIAEQLAGAAHRLDPVEARTIWGDLFRPLATVGAGAWR